MSVHTYAEVQRAIAENNDHTTMRLKTGSNIFIYSTDTLQLASCLMYA